MHIMLFFTLVCFSQAHDMFLESTITLTLAFSQALFKRTLSNGQRNGTGSCVLLTRSFPIFVCLLLIKNTHII